MESITLTPVQLARFEAKVNRAGSGCHLWTAAKQQNGYGVLSIDKKLRYAHRVAYMMENGTIPSGMYVDHICHTVDCVNPTHLQLVTNKQNAENTGKVRAASGFRGVHRNGTGWRAVVRHNYREHASTTFRTPEEANEAAIALRNKLFTNNLLDRQAV